MGTTSEVAIIKQANDERERGDSVEAWPILSSHIFQGAVGEIQVLFY